LDYAVPCNLCRVCTSLSNGLAKRDVVLDEVSNLWTCDLMTFIFQYKTITKGWTAKINSGWLIE